MPKTLDDRTELDLLSQPRFSMTSPAQSPRPDAGPTSAQGWVPGRGAVLLLALTAGIVLWYELGDSRTLASHEAFAAVPARTMLLTGDWVVPYYGGLPRMQKPPLAYWVVATSALVFGELSEWTMRVPATLAALGLAVIIGLWAKRWYGPVAGYAAAFAQVTSVWVITFGRKAEIDMLQCLLTTGALALVAGFSPAESRRRSFARWTGFYALLSLAWLAKFHYGPAMVLAPTVLYLALQFGARGLRPLLQPLGLAMFTAAVVVWPMWMLQRVPDAWNVWQRETVGRAFGAFGHEPIWFYVPHLLSLTLPWTPLALAAILPTWKSAWPGLGRAGRAWLNARGQRWAATQWLLEVLRSGNRREQFLWMWILAQLAVVTLSANKHKHYLIATFPAISILAGLGAVRLVEFIRSGRSLLTRRQAWIATTAVALGSLAVAFGIRHEWPALAEAGLALALLIAAGGIPLLWLVHRRRWTLTGATALVLFLSSYMVVVGSIVPGQDHRRPIAEFAREVRSEAAAGETLFVYQMGMHTIVYYLDDPVQRIEELPQLRERVAAAGSLNIVTWRRLAGEFASWADVDVLKSLEKPGRKHDESLAVLRLTRREGAGKSDLTSPADLAAGPSSNP